MAIVGLAHGDRTTVSGSHACRAPKPADVRRVLPFVRCARWPKGYDGIAARRAAHSGVQVPHPAAANDEEAA